MNTLYLKFIIRLENHNIDFSPKGPLLHRWLPNGESDPIELDVGNSNYIMKIWFKRRGYVRDGMIEFDYDREEVDPTIIPKQGILDAGPMSGLFEMKDVSDDELKAVKENKIGDSNYVTLGKRIVSLIQPRISNFLRILRIQYGQYWLRELLPFDSRYYSLGAYCENIYLKWSLDKTNWSDFTPDQKIHRGTSFVMLNYSDYINYITEEDWNDIKSKTKIEYSPSYVMTLLIQAWEHHNQRNTKYAILDGVTALELAVDELLRNELGKMNIQFNKIDEFNTTQRLPIKTMIVTAMKGNIKTEEINDTLEAIKIRNDIVHEGKNPPNDADKRIMGLINTISKLIEDRDFRFTFGNRANAIGDVKKWEAEKAEYLLKKK